MAEVKTELLWTTNVTPAPTTMTMYPVSQPNGYGRSVQIQRRDLYYAHVFTTNTKICQHRLIYATASEGA